MSNFADTMRDICTKIVVSIDSAMHTAVVLASQQLVMRSPVGDPDHWRANAAPAAARETYNITVDAYNAEIGKGKGRVRRKSAKTLRRENPNKAGLGYVGGRFRANWQIGIGAANESVTDDIDRAGGATIARLTAVAKAAKAGGVIYITNSLPYADRLERGHSKQAPQGMVRLTMLDLPDALRASLGAKK